MFENFRKNVMFLANLATAADEKKNYSIKNAVMAYLIEGYFALTAHSREGMPELMLGYASNYPWQDVTQVYYDLVTLGVDEFDPLVIPVPLVDGSYVIGILKGAATTPREEEYIRPIYNGAERVEQEQLWKELFQRVPKDELIMAVTRVIAKQNHHQDRLLQEIEVAYKKAFPPFDGDDFLAEAEELNGRLSSGSEGGSK